MKQILALLAYTFCLLGIAQINPYVLPTSNFSSPKLEWNNSLEGCVGYTHLYKSMGTDTYGTKMPTELISFDVSLWGIYVSGAFWEKSTGYSVYGFDETITTFVFKGGPSWRLKWNKSKLTFTPYVGTAFYTVNDRSNNAIGQRQDYGLRKSHFLGGARIAYSFKEFEIGLNASNMECGIGVGANIDL